MSGPEDKSRREFLARVAGAGVGASLGGLLGCFPDVGGEWPQVSEECKDGTIAPVEGASRVVEVFGADSVVDAAEGGGKEINAEVMRPMLDRALAELTGGAEQPWQTLLPDYTSATRIGIKVNCLNGQVPTAVPLVKALIESLRESLGVDAERVIVWDRRLDEVSPPPPRHLYDAEEIGAGVMGTITSTTDHSGPGYSETICGVVSGKAPRLSRIFTELTDVTINFPVLKTHDIAGITGALKNIYGIIDNPHEYHTNVVTALPALYRLPPIREKIRLTVLDALVAVTTGGTSSPADTYPKRILVARDPLALDSYALDLVNQLRREKGLDLPDIDPSFTEWLQNGYDLGLGTLDYDLVAVEQPTS